MSGLLELIDIVDCVSFDFFDTMVTRKGVFYPKDIFSIAEDRAVAHLGAKFRGFAALREQAEHAARARASNRGILEVRIDEIYEVLGHRLRAKKEELLLLRDLELACEVETLCCDDVVFSIFEIAQERKKRIYITTDTYFSEQFIENACVSMGYKNSELLVSSVHRRSKRDGSLFELLMERSGTAASRILHLGDNPMSDVSVPLAKGILARLYELKKRNFQNQIRFGSGRSGSISISRILCNISDRAPITSAVSKVRLTEANLVGRLWGFSGLSALGLCLVDR